MWGEKHQGTRGGVAVITGGAMTLFADPLPEDRRAAPWQLASDNDGKRNCHTPGKLEHQIKELDKQAAGN